MLHWTVAKPSGEDQRVGRTVAVGHRVYFFTNSRSCINEAQIDVLVFNTVSLRWVKLTPEKPGRGHRKVRSRRQGHTAVLIEEAVYIWGGDNSKRTYCNNVLYAFDVDAHRWFKPAVSGSVPEERSSHSACVLRKVMFIHGGETQTGLTNDTYKMDTTTMVWSYINNRGIPPPASWCHSATIIGTMMFVFGGWSQDLYNIRVFDTETNCWNTPSTQLSPAERWEHSAFVYKGELHVFGGWTDEDLWKFSPETFCWRKVESKGKHPRSMFVHCCSVVGDQVFIFGGNQAQNNLCVLDLSPSLKTLCKLAVLQHGLEQSGLPHDIRWELAAMTNND